MHPNFNKNTEFAFTFTMSSKRVDTPFLEIVNIVIYKVINEEQTLRYYYLTSIEFHCKIVILNDFLNSSTHV